MIRSLLGFVVLISFMACKSGNTGQPVATNKQPEVYMNAVIDGQTWQAGNVTLNPLGDLLIIKGTDDEGRVLSLNLPKVTGLQSFTIKNGGVAGITWSVSRKEGFTYTAPYQGYTDDGIITITQNSEGFLAGEFQSTISNGGRVLNISKGSFVVMKTKN